MIRILSFLLISRLKLTYQNWTIDPYLEGALGRLGRFKYGTASCVAVA